MKSRFSFVYCLAVIVFVVQRTRKVSKNVIVKVTHRVASERSVYRVAVATDPSNDELDISRADND